MTTLPATATLATGSRGDLGGLIALVAGRETALPLARVSVRTTIAGAVARTEIEQVFQNTLATPMEAVHIFPLPPGGVVTEVQLRCGELIVKAECRGREEAERTFAAAREQGHRAALLTAERTVLNFLQRLCAIATQTSRYVKAVQPHPTQVWDTRKTTPGWRLLEKAAVKCGGGTNHRMGLYDHAMVKDNHHAANPSLEALQSNILRLRREAPACSVSRPSHHVARA